MGKDEGEAGKTAAMACSGNNACRSTAGWTAPWRTTWQAGQTGLGFGDGWDRLQEVLTVAASLRKRELSTWWCNSSTRKMCNCTRTAIQAVNRRAECRPRKTEDFLKFR